MVAPLAWDPLPTELGGGMVMLSAQDINEAVFGSDFSHDAKKWTETDNATGKTTCVSRRRGRAAGGPNDGARPSSARRVGVAVRRGSKDGRGRQLRVASARRSGVVRKTGEAKACRVGVAGG